MCTWPNCKCELGHPDLDIDGSPIVCPLKYNCNTCGQPKDLCVCAGNRYGQRLDNS